MNNEITPAMVNEFIEKIRQPKGSRRVIWNSYSLGTYSRTLHGPIGTPKHQVK